MDRGEAVLPHHDAVGTGRNKLRGKAAGETVILRTCFISCLNTVVSALMQQFSKDNEHW